MKYFVKSEGCVKLQAWSQTMSMSLPSSFEEPDPQDRHTSPLQPSHPSFLLAGNNQEKQKQHRDVLLLSLTAAEQNQAVWTLRRHSSAGPGRVTRASAQFFNPEQGPLVTVSISPLNQPARYITFFTD